MENVDDCLFYYVSFDLNQKALALEQLEGEKALATIDYINENKVSDQVIISLVQDCENYCDPHLDPYENDPYCAKLISANGSFGTNLELDAEENFGEQDVKALIEEEYWKII